MNRQDRQETAEEGGGQPFYLQLRDALRARIERGEYPLGAHLPTEAELCAAFGASRHTVREALRGLVELGLLERRQGAGSVVVARTPPEAFVHSARSLDELWSYTRATRIAVERSETVAVDGEEAALVSAPEGSRWLRIKAMRRNAADSEAVCWVTLYVHLRFARFLSGLGESEEPVYAIIERQSGERVEEAVQEIAALAMPAEAAARLSRKRGAPALRIVRRYLDAGGSPMLVAVSLHPGDGFTHTLRLKREG